MLALAKGLLRKRAAAPTKGKATKRSRPSPAAPTSPDSPVTVSSGDDSDFSGGSELSTSTDDSHHVSPTRQLRPILPTATAAATTAAATTATATAAAPAATTADVRVASPFPIFREANIRTRAEPVETLSKRQQQDLTFSEWLDYFLSHRAYAVQRRYLFSDEQYCWLLGWVTMADPTKKVQYCVQQGLDIVATRWLYHALAANTYEYQAMEYTCGGVNAMELGPVLVCSKEPVEFKGGKTTRRRPESDTATTENLRRRCVPFSQIELVLQHCHSGGLGGSKHHGQVSTWDRVSRDFDGITRDMVRHFCMKCAVCQQQQMRQHKAALVPITAKRLYERIVMDLIDYTAKSSHGYCYILHCVDHYSKFHWAWAIRTKEPKSIAFHLASLLADIGPIEHIQCDQGKEFVGEVLTLLQQWNCGPVRSSAYYPQTNGLVERGNGMIKVALEHWFTQSGTKDWFPVLNRIVYQINCSRPRTTKHVPYELVKGKKPPKWEGLTFAPPLRADVLNRVLDECKDVPAEAVDGPAGVTAASILTTLATTQPASDVADSTPPPPMPRPQLQQSQLLVRESQLPVEELDQLDLDSGGLVEGTTDLAPAEEGPLNRSMAEHLNVDPCRFVRLGGEGGGRCAISAFYNCFDPMFRALPSRRRVAKLDEIRRNMRGYWEELNSSNKQADQRLRRRLRDTIFDMGNSGGSHDESPELPTTLVVRGDSDEEARELAWARLGLDFSESTKSLGTDAIALMAHVHRVNVLLFLCYTETSDFGDGTRQAQQRWDDATAAAKRDMMRELETTQPGGRWLEETTATTQHLVPPFIKQDRPFIIMYQRSHSIHTVRSPTDIPAVPELVPKDDTSGGSGHFEAIVARRPTRTRRPDYVGVFEIGGDTAHEYDRALSLGCSIMTVVEQQKASQTMAAFYDAKSTVAQYGYLDAVGIRVPGVNRRKGDGPVNVPGIVLGIHKKAITVGKSRQVRHHRLYTVWTTSGVVSQKVKIDALVTLSLNNFPELMAFLDTQLTADERLPQDDPSHCDPLKGSARDVPRITLTRLLEMHRSKYTKRTEDQSRKRGVKTRAAADAADTSIAATRADNRRALSLATITNQAASQSSLNRGAQPSYITHIKEQSTGTYTCVWSEPEGNPAESRESKHWMHKQAAYVDVVNAWRASRGELPLQEALQQLQQRRQQRQQQQRERLPLLDVEDEPNNEEVESVASVEVISDEESVASSVDSVDNVDMAVSDAE